MHNMVRPKKLKRIFFEPGVRYFKPRAVSLNDLQEVILTLDELEALRLSNLEELSQGDAAKKMDVHQSTFQRTLARAEKKVTDALVNGKAIKLEGGDYKVSEENILQFRGRSRFGRRGNRICISCGKVIPSVRGPTFRGQRCPKCN